MFQINEDLSIYVTRGDVALFSVTAERNGESFLFQPDDIVRLNVYEKKNCDDVVVRKDFIATAETDRIDILLTKEDTKIGKIISKPTDYWYEVVLNPVTNPQTIIGYDDDGAKLFRLYPEGNDGEEIEKEDIPVVDNDFSETSERPLQNHVITRRFNELEKEIDETAEKITSKDIVPITKAEYDELYEKGTYQENVVYLILGAEYNPDEDKTALEIANDALIKANKALEIAKDPYEKVPIEKGGTGASTVEEALKNLGLTNKADVQIVSYVGTGTYGVDNPCSLTFDFAPRVIKFMARTYKPSSDSTTQKGYNAYLGDTNDPAFLDVIVCEPLPTEFDTKHLTGLYYEPSSSEYGCPGKKSTDGKTISWYSARSSGSQCNTAGNTYYFMAIG